MKKPKTKGEKFVRMAPALLKIADQFALGRLTSVQFGAALSKEITRSQHSAVECMALIQRLEP
jgi:hypothetical protein